MAELLNTQVSNIAKAQSTSTESVQITKLVTFNNPSGSSNRVYSAGTKGQIIKSDGTNTYWGNAGAKLDGKNYILDGNMELFAGPQNGLWKIYDTDGQALFGVRHAYELYGGVITEVFVSHTTEAGIQQTRPIDSLVFQPFNDGENIIIALNVGSNVTNTPARITLTGTYENGDADLIEPTLITADPKVSRVQIEKELTLSTTLGALTGFVLKIGFPPGTNFDTARRLYISQVVLTKNEQGNNVNITDWFPAPEDYNGSYMLNSTSSIPDSSYNLVGGNNLKLLFNNSPSALREAIHYGHFEKIHIGDYWPITLSGSYVNYSASSPTTNTMNKEFKLIVAAIDPYLNYGTSGKLSQGYHHIIFYANEYIPIVSYYFVNSPPAVSGKNRWMTSCIYNTLNASDGVFYLIPSDFRTYIINMYSYFKTASSTYTWVERGNLFLPEPEEVFAGLNYTTTGPLMNQQWPLFRGNDNFKSAYGYAGLGIWLEYNDYTGTNYPYINTSGQYATTTSYQSAKYIPLCFVFGG